MNIHEHQAKELLSEFGAPVSKGIVIYNLSDIDKLPHLPIDIFNDLMLKLTIFFPRFSEQKVAATLASLRPANFKLYTLAYILLLQLSKHLVN